MCNKNYDQMVYGSWDILRNRRTDGQTDGWKKWHIEVGAPPKNIDWLQISIIHIGIIHVIIVLFNLFTTLLSLKRFCKKIHINFFWQQVFASYFFYSTISRGKLFLKTNNYSNYQYLFFFIFFVWFFFSHFFIVNSLGEKYKMNTLCAEGLPLLLHEDPPPLPTPQHLYPHNFLHSFWQYRLNEIWDKHKNKIIRESDVIS